MLFVALQEIGSVRNVFLWGSLLLSSSFCFFLLFLSLAFLGGGGSAGCSTRRFFCCGLTSTTAVCWLFCGSCFRDDSCSRRSPSASASWRGSPGDSRAVLFWRFRVFFLLFLPKRRFCSCFCRLFRAWFPVPSGWGGIFPRCFFFSPPPPPLALPLASSIFSYT